MTISININFSVTSEATTAQQHHKYFCCSRLKSFTFLAPFNLTAENTPLKIKSHTCQSSACVFVCARVAETDDLRAKKKGVETQLNI